MLRLKVTVVDFAGQTVIIQEKKTAKGKTTTCRVPLSAFLISVLQDWLKIHPGGAHLFCATVTVVRSRNVARRPATRE